jgi:4-amino-4-deoxychorismate lyase
MIGVEAAGPASAAVAFRGDERIDAFGPDDRGVAYGDGLFETMRVHRGDVHWWDPHWARLVRGAVRLRLQLPDEARVHLQAKQVPCERDGVLKLLVTRGSGGRGYALPRAAVPTWMLSFHPLPSAPPRAGLTLRWCDTRLAEQPALAGIKHCNRLEQVLARSEWDDPAIHEGLLRSTGGDVVCATAANLFVLRDGRWLTPAVDHCGVAGVCRGWAMERLMAVETRLGLEDVETADAIFVCNAVRGILPVARLGERSWLPHPQVQALRQRLAAEHPAFAMELS